MQLSMRCRLVVPPVVQEISMIKGKHTSELAALLGYHSDGELIHRGNLAQLLPGEPQGT